MSLDVINVHCKYQFIPAEALSLLCRTSSDSRRQWSLVMQFCKVHNIPPSTSYLEECAKSSDWLQFLIQAQLFGYQPREVSSLCAIVTENSLSRAFLVFDVQKKKRGKRKKIDSFNQRISHCGDTMRLKAPQLPGSWKLSEDTRYPPILTALSYSRISQLLHFPSGM